MRDWWDVASTMESLPHMNAFLELRRLRNAACDHSRHDSAFLPTFIVTCTNFLIDLFLAKFIGSFLFNQFTGQTSTTVFQLIFPKFFLGVLGHN